jgi:flavin-dependent dehydrogenase
MEPIRIAGAGIAGLTAAIHLARNGIPVKLYEKGEDVGSRFKGDIQALENWSTQEDVLSFLTRIGIAPEFYHKPFMEVDVIDDLQRVRTIKSSYRNAFYVVKRGSDPNSIDRFLKKTALDLGVHFEFGRAVKDTEAHIIAKGPRFARSVAYGIRANVDHPDRVIVLFDNRLAPKSYAYVIIVGGEITIASTLMSQFHRAKECFDMTLERTRKIYGINPTSVEAFVGYIDFSLKDSYSETGRILVGESAGLQDYLFGFGMRYAFASGYFAARSITEGTDYDELLRREMRTKLKSSLVNRFVYENLGNHGYRLLIHRWRKCRDIHRLMNRWYGWRPYKYLLFPVVMRWFRTKRALGRMPSGF